MRILKLEEERIKIILSRGDLERLDINPENITTRTEDINKVLSKLIKAVGEETGIFIEEGQVAIGRGMGEDAAVILVTRFRNGTKQKLRSVRISERLIFEIPHTEDFFMMLRCINDKILRRMCIYQYKSGYYICLPRFPVPVVMWEFSGKCRKSRTLEAIIMEHGRLIARDNEVVRMAEEIKKNK